ncbi:1927_t:CDS:2, partial [Cetraspora pellucida]
LIKYSYKLVTKHESQDIITMMTPIKIQQQIYAALVSYSFSNLNHPFIQKLSDELICKMDQYHIIEDNNIKKGPSSKIKWYKADDQIKVHAMEGHWDNSEINNIEIDFCSFPSIIAEEQVFCKGHVVVCPWQNK